MSCNEDYTITLQVNPCSPWAERPELHDHRGISLAPRGDHAALVGRSASAWSPLSAPSPVQVRAAGDGGRAPAVRAFRFVDGSGLFAVLHAAYRCLARCAR